MSKQKGFFDANLLLERWVIIFFGYYDIVLEGVVPVSTLMVS